MFPIFAGANPSATGYNLTRSLRFRASASAYLNRTFTTPTNNIKWTWSGWVKRGDISSSQCLFGAGNNSNVVYAFGGFSSNSLDFYSYDNALTFRLTTTAVYRDPSAWYHVVFICDTANATSSDRVQLWVNGSRITAFSTATYPSSSASVLFNTAAQPQTIGLVKTVTYNTFYDGYITEINFIDGQALTPSSFGSTNATTGVWQPAKYTGTYGTNGFYLPFTDNSALTTSSNVGLGKDFSGNGNYWTTNNISLTSGVTYDSMTDVPTLTDASTANFPTINAVNYNSTYITLSEANLRQTYAGVSAAAASQATMAIPTTGKWYFEVYINATGGGSGERIRVGICAPTDSVSGNTIDNSVNHYMQMSNGQKRTGTTDSTYGASFSAGQIIQVLFDATAGSIYFGQNNSFANGSGSFNQTFATATAAFTGISGQFIPAFVTYGGADISVNFGQRPFTYTPPTGFVALNTYNLPDSTIVKGNTVMDATLWTGTGGASQVITNAGTFKPDLVWMKTRNQAYGHLLFDSVRGTSLYLQSNGTGAEVTDATMLSSINSDGFTVGSSAFTNGSGNTEVAWQWQAGQGSTSSNTNGSITSTVSVNASAGFSVVTYTGTNTATNTVGHGLGVAPAIWLIKNRTSGSGNWVYNFIYSGAVTYLFLNSTQAGAAQGSPWSTSPTSSVVTLGGSDTNTCAAANNYVMYAWTPIAGFSAFGSYTGNGSADGPFVYTGFRPKWVTIKRTDAVQNWATIDTSRDVYNVTNQRLFPNLSSAEDTGIPNFMDILSNGFKLRDSNVSENASGGTYIYMAYAENPFKNALAR